MVHDAVDVPTLSCTTGVIVTVLVYVTNAKVTEAKQMAKQTRQMMALLPIEANSFRGLFNILSQCIHKIRIVKRFMKLYSIFEIKNLLRIHQDVVKDSKLRLPRFQPGFFKPMDFMSSWACREAKRRTTCGV